MLGRLFRFVRRIVVLLILLVVLALLPVIYIETMCGDDPITENRSPIITDPEWVRAEANSYLTYPEWHIVYAYEGLAKVLETGDEHQLGYVSSISGFWKSFCQLNRQAQQKGGADFATRTTIHVIGVSFTLEMGLKAAYEETLGRLFALFRGGSKSAQDIEAARMAADYATFLQQTPWYKYDFDEATNRLWEQPITHTVRSRERRFALGLEWKAKAAYAGVIANAVAATGGAKLRIRSVVVGMLPWELSQIEGIDIVDVTPDHVIIETPRYRVFTRIAKQIADAGGNIAEIAGNDDILVTVTGGREAFSQGNEIALLAEVDRDGFGEARHLFSVKVGKLTDFIRSLNGSSGTLEHVYDY